MTKLVIVGEEPSRLGDGRAFTGPSGKRLAQLLGLRDYAAMDAQLTLTNIFPRPTPRPPLTARRRIHNPPRPFQQTEARDRGVMMVREWARDPELIAVLACGCRVAQALRGKRLEQFQGAALTYGPAQGVDVWHFPHPSGRNRFWNDTENVERAREFLIKLLKYYGIALTK